ncbi:hypothetical protein pb186bvf_019480 [Paramecium bursaria]
MSQKPKKTIIRDPQVDAEEMLIQKEEFFAPALEVFKQGPIQSEEQLEFVKDFMQQVEFFKSSCPETSSIGDFTKLCCQNLQYEFFPRDSIIFNIDEPGDKFYIILKGKASVYIKRQPQQIEQDETAILPKVQKMREAREAREKRSVQLSETPIEIEDISKFMEKIIKRQQKPYKIIESEISLLRCGNVEKHFTSNIVCKFMSVAQYIPGQSFGENALTTDKPRGASIVATSDLHVVYLNKENYKKVFDKEIKNQQMKIEYFMKIFPALTKFKLSKLLLSFFQHIIPPNVVIWKQGDHVDSMLLIREGEVQLEQNVVIQTLKEKNKEIQKRENIIISNLTGGCFIGEVDVFQGFELREFSVKTLQQTIIYSISVENFNIVRKQFPEFNQVMQQIALKSYNWMQKRINDVVGIKRANFFLDKKEDIHYIERRYVHEFDQKATIMSDIGSPIIRSVNHTKLTKQQVVEQNQTIYDQFLKLDKQRGDDEEFNMLKMASDNFQKCLLIRVEKQFEQFQPSKPKAKTPYFSKSSKDIKGLLDQIKKQQLPTLGTAQPTYRVSHDDEVEIVVKPIRVQSRIINPNVQQKVDLIRKQKSSKSLQYPKISRMREPQQFFELTDGLASYQPLHSNLNKTWRRSKLAESRTKQSHTDQGQAN